MNTSLDIVQYFFTSYFQSSSYIHTYTESNGLYIFNTRQNAQNFPKVYHSSSYQFDNLCFTYPMAFKLTELSVATD